MGSSRIHVLLGWSHHLLIQYIFELHGLLDECPFSNIRVCVVRIRICWYTLQNNISFADKLLARFIMDVLDEITLRIRYIRQHSYIPI